MNTRSLIDRVTRRIPGYTDAEYLDELAEAYEDVWNKVILLDNSWFEDTIEVTVVTASTDFDLLFNTDSKLNQAVSPLLHTVRRIRVLPPSAADWVLAEPKHDLAPSFLNQEGPDVPENATSGPYFYRVYGKGTIQFGRPLIANTKIEVKHIFAPVPLAITSAGTVSSAALVVTGTGTFFKNILPPDLRARFLTGLDIEAQVEAEIVVDGFPYRVDAIASDTSLNTFVAAGASTDTFSLSVVPDLPVVHHSVLAAIATRNLFSTPGDDSRFQEWAAIAQSKVENMMNALASRQAQRNPKKRPFVPRSSSRTGLLA